MFSGEALDANTILKCIVLLFAKKTILKCIVLLFAKKIKLA